MKLAVLHTSGKNTQLEVADSVFGATPNLTLLSRAVYVFESNQRQGTSKVKTRSNINRTKQKWYKQKGTGRARHGARTPSIFVGGGVSHGPTGMRDWTRDLTKQQKKKAMVYALSSRSQDIAISDEIETVTGKTKHAATLLSTLLPTADRVLIVLHQPIENVLRSTKNIESVLITQASRLNVYELLLADKIVMTKDAVRALETRLGAKAEEKPVIEKQAEAKKSAVAEPKVVKTVDKTVKAIKKSTKIAAKKVTKKVVKKA